MSINVIDVKDSEIVHILKSQWFSNSLDIKDEERQKGTIFNDLLLTYSKLRRIPKLISKLLLAICETVCENSCNLSFSHGYINTSLLEKFSQCVLSLPFGQTFELWESFIEAYQKIDSSDINNSRQGGQFMIAQFFSTFLLHARLFEDATVPVIQRRVASLMDKTYQLLQEKCHLLTKQQTSTPLIKLSHLMMVHAYNEVKFVFNTLKNIDSSPSQVSEACSKFEVILFQEVLTDYLPLITEDDKRFGYIAFKLLLQGIKRNVMAGEVNLETTELKTIAFLLLKATVSSTKKCRDAIWDFNINSINSSNYHIAFWSLFLNHLPIFVQLIDQKHLVALCFAIIEVLSEAEDGLQTDSCGSLESSIKMFVASPFFTNSKTFQTAFVTAIWQHSASLVCTEKRNAPETEPDELFAAVIFRKLYTSRGKWLKYADTTPKITDEQEMNCMWLTVTEIANVLNGSLAKSVVLMGKLKVPETHRLLKILNFLELEYLLPGNQMRCLLGLSTLFFLLANSCSESATDVSQSMNLAVRLLMLILEGVRSIWLFDFLLAVPYIKAVIANIEQLSLSGVTEDSEVHRKFLDSLFNLCTRNIQSLLATEGYLPELLASMSECKTSIVAFQCLVERLIQLLQRAYLQPQYKEVCERLAESACHSVAKYMRHWKKDNQNCLHVSSSISYRGLILLAMNPTSKFDEEKRKKWFKHLGKILEIAFASISESCEEVTTASFFDFICTVCAHRQNLQSCTPNDFFIKVWKCLRHVLLQKTRTARSCLSFPDVTQVVTSPPCYFCLNIKSAKANSENLSPVSNGGISSNSYDLSDFFQKHIFTETERSVFANIAKTSSKEEFEAICQELSNDIESMQVDIGTLDPIHLSLTLLSVSCLFDSLVNDGQVYLLSKVIQKCLMNLHIIMGQTCKNSSCLLQIVVPSLNFICSVLKKGKKSLPKQSVLQCLHSCVAVKAKLYVDQPSIFIKVYSSLWSVLNELMVNHTYIVLSSIPTFISNVTYLLKLIVHASSQDFLSTYSNETQEEILLCVQNMDRLLGSIAKQKKEFAKVVPYLVADYVDLVQNVTIHPSAKAILVNGINKLLDICSEESLRMLAVNISHSCREIFSGLVKNYKRYRFVGQI